MRKLVGIAVLALVLPLAAQELPSAPSAAKQAQQQAFRAQIDASPGLTQGITPRDFGPGWNALRPRSAAVADHRAGGFVGKLVAPLIGGHARSAGDKPQAFGARVMGALSQLADIEDAPEDVTPSNYSQYLGMAVSDKVSNAYLPLDGRGMRHSGGGFGAHVGAGTGLELMGQFLPGVKRFLGGHAAPKRQREALRWRTGGPNAPGSLH